VLLQQLESCVPRADNILGKWIFFFCKKVEEMGVKQPLCSPHTQKRVEIVVFLINILHILPGAQQPVGNESLPGATEIWPVGR